jgi:hypothetical protein
MLLPYVKKGVGTVQELAVGMNSLTDEQKEMIIKVLGVVAAVGPAIFTFGKMTKSISRVATNISIVGKAFKRFGGIMGIIKSPAGMVIAILGALVIAGILVYKNWDKIRTTAGKMWNYVKKIFTDMGISGQSVKEELTPIGKKFTQIGEKSQELWTVIQPPLTKIGDITKLVFCTTLGAAVGGGIGLLDSLLSSATEIFGGLLTGFGGLIDFLTGVFTGNWSKAWNGVKEIFKGAFQALVGLAKTPINAVIGIINGAISGINRLGVSIPDWVPGVGGKSFSVNIPLMPTLARGTQSWKGGLVQVSERGGEIIDLPQGSRVYPHDESVKKAYADGKRKSQTVIRIAKLADQIIIREEADIDKIVNKLADKLENVSLNIGGEDIEYLY